MASTDGFGNVSVGFSGVFAGNGRGISQYAVVAGGSPTCSVSDPGADDPGIGFSAGGGQVKQASTDAAPLGFTVQAGSATTFTVFASNGQGCARAQVTATPRSAPSPRLLTVPPDRGRYDAGYGVLVRGAGGGRFHADETFGSGLRLDGEIRALRWVRRGDGTRLLVAARNNLPLQVFRADAPGRTEAPRTGTR